MKKMQPLVFTADCVPIIIVNEEKEVLQQFIVVEGNL